MFLTMFAFYMCLILHLSPFLSVRYNHAIAVAGDSAYLFGGTDGQQCFNDLFKLDRTTVWLLSVSLPDLLVGAPPVSGFVWAKVSQKGPVPLKREEHTMVAVGNTLFVFGGMDQNQSNFNDLHAFDIRSSPFSHTLT